MKLPPEICCSRWPHLQKGQWGNVPAAMHNPELKQLILVGPRSSGMGSIALCLGQSFTTWKLSLTLLPLTFPYTTVLAGKESQRFNAVSDGLHSQVK